MTWFYFDIVKFSCYGLMILACYCLVVGASFPRWRYFFLPASCFLAVIALLITVGFCFFDSLIIGEYTKEPYSLLIPETRETYSLLIPDTNTLIVGEGTADTTYKCYDQGHHIHNGLAIPWGSGKWTDAEPKTPLVISDGDTYKGMVWREKTGWSWIIPPTPCSEKCGNIKYFPTPIPQPPDPVRGTAIDWETGEEGKGEPYGNTN